MRTTLSRAAEWRRVPLNFDVRLFMRVPTIGFEEPTTLTKSEIALQQLCEAISLFTACKFLPAVTLAGAAEEIFGKLLVRQSKQPVVKESAQAILELQDKLGLVSLQQASEKELIDQWNAAKNTAKHLGGAEDEPVTLNLCDEAYWMIKRDLHNAELLGVQVPNKIEFENWFIIHVGLA